MTAYAEVDGEFVTPKGPKDGDHKRYFSLNIRKAAFNDTDVVCLDPLKTIQALVKPNGRLVVTYVSVGVTTDDVSNIGSRYALSMYQSGTVSQSPSCMIGSFRTTALNQLQRFPCSIPLHPATRQIIVASVKGYGTSDDISIHLEGWFDG